MAQAKSKRTPMGFKSPTIRSGGNAKTIKGDKESEYETAIMYFAPWKTALDSGKIFNSCPMAEQAGCIDACLFTAGRGRMSNVQAGRIRKTVYFAKDRAGFMRDLAKDVSKFIRHCEKRNRIPAIRLNGTSDIRWELIPVEYNGEKFANLMAAFPNVTFYDYTKIANRRNLPDNYKLTFSYSGANPKYAAMAETAIGNGMNVAVVFREKRDIPAKFLGIPTIDGDRDDMRFLDPAGVVVALYAKGQAKTDDSGFVVDVAA